MAECCKIGFKWNGTPTGKETKLGGLDCYVAGSGSTDSGVLVIADIFGWTLPNARLLADSIAAETRSTVYMPDYFHGEVIDPDMMSDPAKRAKFDLPAMLARHSKDIRYPEISANATELKAKHKTLTALGYCYGAWAVLKLGNKSKPLIDAGMIAHPSLVEKAEIDALGVPLLINAPEHDPAFTQELKDYANTKIPTLGVDYVYEFYPKVMHGFAVKGDPNDPVQKEAFERCKSRTSQWIVQYSQ